MPALKMLAQLLPDLQMSVTAYFRSTRLCSIEPCYNHKSDGSLGYQ